MRQMRQMLNSVQVLALLKKAGGHLQLFLDVCPLSKDQRVRVFIARGHVSLAMAQMEEYREEIKRLAELREGCGELRVDAMGDVPGGVVHGLRDVDTPATPAHPEAIPEGAPAPSLGDSREGSS